MTRLNAIRKRLEAATPGPWTDDGDFGVASPADAALIAHAPQDLRDLLELTEAVRSYRDAPSGAEPSRWMSVLLVLARLEKN